MSRKLYISEQIISMLHENEMYPYFKGSRWAKSAGRSVYRSRDTADGARCTVDFVAARSSP